MFFVVFNIIEQTFFSLNIGDKVIYVGTYLVIFLLIRYISY